MSFQEQPAASDQHLGFFYNPDGVSNSVLDIHRTQSAFSQFFYQIREEYQVTYESASGTAAKDYLNIATLSGDQSFFSQESVSEHNRYFRTDLVHYHDFYELMIVLEGVVVNHIEGQDYQYPAGSACLINRGLRHAEGFASQAKLLFIGLSPEYIRELEYWCTSSKIPEEQELSDSPMMTFIRQDLQEPGGRSYLDFFPAYQNERPYHLLHRVAEELLSALIHPFCGASYVIRGKTAEILALLNSSFYHYANIELALNKDYLLFSRIANFMEEKEGRISRAELARLTNYSADYLNRIVKKYTGLSLYDYGMLFCLRKAENYIKNSDLPISEIAVLCGFSNKTHFYKRFEEQYSLSPGAYRKAVRKSARSVSPVLPEAPEEAPLR
ncbi:MAG: helix-turn-helix transcriptional regulator [Lachnospiraceae bacterium]|nr:helix-turn-helix transcriptional regulator [Lachnospiraceae bacterium]